MALSPFSSNRPTLVVSGLLVLATSLCAQPVRITQQIEDSATVQLAGNVAPKAQVQYDQGPVEASFPMQYVTLLLQPSARQKASLAQLLTDQQDRSSAKYHKWLTPELYADSFGLSPADMEKIASWLQAEGFAVNYQARGRNWIAFSGNAAQIQHTFHTEIHQYTIGGEKHFANATNPSIPAALAGVVTRIQGLDDFRLKPAHGRGKSIQPGGLRPNYTDAYGNHSLAPGDIATIYDLSSLYSLGFNGSAQTVVVVGQTDFYATDISDFRTSFNLPSQPVQSPPCASNALCKVLTGPDPGFTADVDEAELDLELSGAVAPNAAIYYVYSTDVFTSVQYAIDGDFGPVISMSYGACEQDNLGSLDWGRSLAQQANSFGITWVASSGDGGAADCDWGASTGSQATLGLAVDFPASIPEVTGVGGTEFSDGGGGTYWNSSNGANGGSAITYIPEMGWNDTAYGTGLSTTLAAGGGGVSTYYPTPVWQTGTGFPNDGFRDVPDVSMSASWEHDGYQVCILGCNAVYGGTSAATPVFAGILALLNQYLVSTGAQSQAGLGNINPNLYALYKSSPGAFHDIKTGSNVVPCQIGTPDCTTGSFGYTAQPGYDQVTGLGSIDGFNLIVTWAGPVPAQLNINKSHSGAFNQGQADAPYTVTVSNSATAEPTIGTVTVSETVPSGLTLVSMAGAGWDCSGTNCTRSDVLSGGASYPAITALVNVAMDAASPQINQVTVTGGGSTGATATDSTSIDAGTLADLVVTSLTGPATGNPAGSINVSCTVLNQGAGSAGAFQLEYYFSPTANPSLSTAIDTTWGCPITGLTPGASFTCTGPVGVPASLTPGTWYLAALADSNNQVAESNKNNNWRIADTGPVTLGPVLTILGAGLDGNLYSVVPATGATTLIGPLAAVMSDIAGYNGSLYGLSSDGVLYTLDPNSGAGTPIGTGTGASVIALTFGPSGILYAAGGDSLYTIDTSTGSATLVGSGSGSGTYEVSGDLVFDFEGDLYLTSVGSSGDQLFSLNPVTGQGTLIGNIGFSDVYGLAYYNGTAYGFTLFGQVLTIDLSTGVGTQIASYTPGFNGTTVVALAVTSPPVITSPVQGITLSGSLANFSWSAVSGATQYQLTVGSTAGGANIFSGTTAGTSQTVDFIPCTGGTIYVQLAAEVGGSFQPASDYSYPCKSAIGDFNADGHQDLVWQNNSTRQVTVNYYGGASPVFQNGWNWLNSTSNPGWHVVGAADFDKNGVPDLVWQNDATAQVVVHYYGGAGGAVYQGWAYLDAAGEPGWTVVGVADMNGDGTPDLIWQNTTNTQVVVHYYGGAGGAVYQGSATVDATGAAGWTVVGVADFDGNGTPDLVWQNTTTTQVVVHYYGYSGGAPVYQSWAYLDAAGAPGWTVRGAADLNADGVPDLVWQNNATGQVVVHFYGGEGGAVYEGWNWLNAATTLGWHVAALADFDGNGEPDLVWQDDTTRQVSVNYYYLGGAVYQGWNWLDSAGVPGWTLVGTGDFDGNGVPDLVWQNDSTRQVVVHYYGYSGGAPVYQSWAYLDAAGEPGWTVVGVADMNGDGVPDLIWQNNSTTQVVVHYYGGTGGAVYQGWAYLDGVGAPGWTVVGAADFDGNGVPDLIWQNQSTRQVVVHYYGGAGGTVYQGWAYLDQAGVPGWTVAGASDFDGNGVPDLVWQNDSSGQVVVHYYGGAGGAVYKGWDWLNSTANTGWRVIVPESR